MSGRYIAPHCSVTDFIDSAVSKSLIFKQIKNTLIFILQHIANPVILVVGPVILLR